MQCKEQVISRPSSNILIKFYIYNVSVKLWTPVPKTTKDGSMKFRLNSFRLKDISSKRHFVEYDIASKFCLKVSKFV